MNGRPGWVVGTFHPNSISSPNGSVSAAISVLGAFDMSALPFSRPAASREGVREMLLRGIALVGDDQINYIT
jgi:hypothetical protein